MVSMPRISPPQTREMYVSKLSGPGRYRELLYA
jgi:hypothetical protein